MNYEFIQEDNSDIIILKATIFYPTGGGQGHDVGAVTMGEEVLFHVKDVIIKDGVVLHIGSFARGKETLAVGLRVHLAVDEETRRRNARLHSAGHLLDLCMEHIGLGPDVLTPTKGSHTVEQCYVEYKGKVEKEEFQRVIDGLNECMGSLIKEGGEVKARVMAYDDAVTEGISLPSYIAKGSTPRIVTMGSSHCPCGGTHVKNLTDIQGVQVTELRVKKGVTRVTYRVPGIN